MNKILSIYKLAAGDYIVELEGEIKETFEAKEQFLEYLKANKFELSNYEIEVAEDLWALVLNTLSK